jgi:hypothetical protein
VRSLQLGGNNIGDAELELLLPLLQSMAHLTALDLSSMLDSDSSSYSVRARCIYLQGMTSATMA